MDRKLAKIVIVDAINSIENADAIEVAKIGGWNVVVKKGEFTPLQKAYISYQTHAPSLSKKFCRFEALDQIYSPAFHVKL